MKKKGTAVSNNKSSTNATSKSAAVLKENSRHIVGKLLWRGDAFPVYEGDNFIGRHTVCEIKLNHTSISSKHAEIKFHESLCYVRDLRSRNGTFVQVPIAGKDTSTFQKLNVLDNCREVKDGNKIRFGMVCCEFRLIQNSEETQIFPIHQATNAYDSDTTATEDNDEHNVILNNSCREPQQLEKQCDEDGFGNYEATFIDHEAELDTYEYPANDTAEKTTVGDQHGATTGLVEHVPVNTTSLKCARPKGNDSNKHSDFIVHDDSSATNSPIVSGIKNNLKRPFNEVVESDESDEKVSEKSVINSAVNDTTQEDTIPVIKILFTKIEESQYSNQLSEIRNIEVTTDPTVATICVTTKQLKRTPKLLVALNSQIQYIVNESWIIDSAKLGYGVPIVENDSSYCLETYSEEKFQEFLAHLERSPYLIKDEEKEELWGFNLCNTLSRIKFAHSKLGTRNHLKPLSGIWVYCTKGVCGQTAPVEAETIQIVSSCGGQWVTNFQEFAGEKWPKKKRSNSRLEKEHNFPGILMIISSTDVVKKEVKKEMIEIAKLSGSFGIYSTESIFRSVLRQQLDLRSEILEGYTF